MTHIHPEAYSFLQGILDDSGMTDLDGDSKKRMIEELFARFDSFINTQMLSHMPEKYQHTFKNLKEQDAPGDELEQYLLDHVPDAEAVFDNAVTQFRELYLKNMLKMQTP